MLNEHCRGSICSKAANHALPRGKIMSQASRLQDILILARRDGRVSVDGLAQHFDVTVQTIRRDLSELAEQGKLQRVHGGAILPSTVANIGYTDRRDLNDAGKAAIARAVARDVPNGCSLFLNIGTTTEAVARALLGHRDIMVLTNNLNVANILVDNPNCEIIVVGGLLRRADGGLVGSVTTQAIGQFKFDIAVISCSALDQDGDMLDYDIQEVGVSQAILKQARRSFLVADHTKLQRRAPARIGSLAQMDIVYTDAPLPVALAQACRGWGTTVNVASMVAT
jgi:DeoR family transcriptional regulator, glycerol-3-phosphate regulon repressor